MQPLPHAIIESIATACVRRGVLRLELTGSAATGEFDPQRSDYDFLVDFGTTPRGGLDDPYFALLEDLENLLKRRVDLIELSCLRNLVVKASMERNRVPIYAAA